MQLQKDIHERQIKRRKQAATRCAKKNEAKGKPLTEGDVVFITVPDKWKQLNDERYEYEARTVERKLNGTCKVQ